SRSACRASAMYRQRSARTGSARRLFRATSGLAYASATAGTHVPGGLASGDFEPVFRALVGDNAAVSPTSILKLKAHWQQEYEAWKKRPLCGRYVYLYADGSAVQQASQKDISAARGRVYGRTAVLIHGSCLRTPGPTFCPPGMTGSMDQLPLQLSGVDD